MGMLIGVLIAVAITIVFKAIRYIKSPVQTNCVSNNVDVNSINLVSVRTPGISDPYHRAFNLTVFDDDD